MTNNYFKNSLNFVKFLWLKKRCELFFFLFWPWDSPSGGTNAIFKSVNLNQFEFDFQALWTELMSCLATFVRTWYILSSHQKLPFSLWYSSIILLFIKILLKTHIEGVGQPIFISKILYMNQTYFRLEIMTEE